MGIALRPHATLSCATIMLCDLRPLAARALISHPGFAFMGGSLLASTRRARLMRSTDLFKNETIIYVLSLQGREKMKFETVKGLDDEKFRRLTGVKRATFNKMVDILDRSIKARKNSSGRKRKLSVEDSLLMTLEYIREYRTYFHVSQSYGVSESNTYKTVKWVEDTLIKHPDFALPGRKALLKSTMGYDVILIDTTETPIERPKKSKSTFTQEKRKGIP